MFDRLIIQFTFTLTLPSFRTESGVVGSQIRRRRSCSGVKTGRKINHIVIWSLRQLSVLFLPEIDTCLFFFCRFLYFQAFSSYGYLDLDTIHPYNCIHIWQIILPPVLISWFICYRFLSAANQCITILSYVVHSTVRRIRWEIIQVFSLQLGG